MRIHVEDVLGRIIAPPVDTQCLHAAIITPMDGADDAPAFLMRIVHHGESAGDYDSAEDYVPSDEVRLSDFAMDENDLVALAAQVVDALDMARANKAQRN